MRECEICGSELTAKQQRFCSRKCRNSAAGRISAAQHQPPDRERLAKFYLLPPEGQGLSFEAIGKIYGVTDVTVRNWIKTHGLLQDRTERLRYHRIQHSGPRIAVPPKEELQWLYQMPPGGQGLTQDQMAEHYDVDRMTVRRWLERYNLLEPHSQRHSKRMAGSGSHAWKGGTSRNYHANVMKRSGKPERCEWCGTTDQVQVHHIDHDKRNGVLSNLMWLCGYCNRLEAQIYHLIQFGRAIATWTDDDGQVTLVIKFGKGE